MGIHADRQYRRGVAGSFSETAAEEAGRRMIRRPLDPAESRDPAALTRFLESVRQTAAADRHVWLVSISIAVDALDPLAVLESIFEPGERHFYVERPDEGVALAGADAVVEFSASGAERFAACQQFIDDTLAHTVAVGEAEAPFGGPHFFAAFTFEPNFAGEAAAFPPASLFVPRWQVGARDGRTMAVANLAIQADTNVAHLAERVWRAHAKFHSFDYAGVSVDENGNGAHRATAASDGEEARAYVGAVESALSDIRAGRYEKIVLSRRRAVRTDAPTGLHPLRVLNGLRQRFGDCFAFSVANGKGQSFIGASPERLLEVRSGKLRTEGLAGSARRGARASEDAAMAAGLARDEKELHEHRLVVDAISGELQGLGLQPVFSAKPGLRRFANVQHLHTAIGADLPPSVRLLDVAARLHPTPAVGGSPRSAALPRIAELERGPRGLYAGALGWIDARGDGELLVGLRSALIDGATAVLYAGAGIVAGSDSQRELVETELKFRAVLDALA
jgi:menaquinone-specific isochorismate synthase